MGRAERIAALVVIVVVGACNALTDVGKLDVTAGGGGDDGGAPDSAPAIVVEAGADGALPPDCSDGEVACTGRTAATCVSGSWQKSDCPELCDQGKCARFPSCRNAAGDGCGAPSTSCCDSVAVPSSTFLRRNQPNLPATVSAFSLDRYEVTVGRFRAFVDAGGGTQAKPPTTGSGAHPKIAGSGWQAAWNVSLPADAATLQTSLAADGTATWTPASGVNEHRPINFVSWPLAFAFCAWDGARLPTYTELQAAAAGGDEDRVYPWSVPPTDATLDTDNAVQASCNCNYLPPHKSCATTCTGCADTPADIAPVGLLPAGAGKWGHRDLAGNIAEWSLDVGSQLPMLCNDCACVFTGDLAQGSSSCEPGGKKNGQFILVGGGWRDGSDQLRLTTNPQPNNWDKTQDDIGFRCAR